MAWWSHHWKLLALVGLGFVLRITRLDCQSLWRDEVDAVRFASLPLGDLLRFFSTPGQNGPLYYLLLRPWLRLAGDSEFALRYLSLACGVLVLPLAYQVARRLTLPQRGSPDTGAPEAIPLLVLILTATSPYLIWYSQEGKMYSLALLLVLLSMDRYLAALGGGGKGCWLAYVLFASAGFYVHLITALILPAQILLFCLSTTQTRKAIWKPWLLSVGGMVIPYLPLLVWQAPLLVTPAETGYSFVPLQDMLYSLLTAFSLGVVQTPRLWTILPFLGALLAVVLHWADRDYRLNSLGAVAAWLLVPVLALFLITLIRPLFTARYLIFVLPAYVVLLAMGIVAIGRRSALLAGCLLLAVLVVQVRGVSMQATVPVKADFRATTHYVSRSLQAQDLVLFQIPYGRHSFDYYLRTQSGDRERIPAAPGRYRLFLPLLEVSDHTPYRWAEGPYTNSGMDAAEVDRRMKELVADSDTVWLVASETPLWDERGLVQAWLDGHAVLVEKADFVKVAARRYEFR